MICRIIPISWNFAGDHSMACRKIPLSWIFLPCSLSTAGQGACNGFEAERSGPRVRQFRLIGQKTCFVNPSKKDNCPLYGFHSKQ